MVLFAALAILTTLGSPRVCEWLRESRRDKLHRQWRMDEAWVRMFPERVAVNPTDALEEIWTLPTVEEPERTTDG